MTATTEPAVAALAREGVTIPSAPWAPPAGIADLFGRPPLVAAEDPDAYQAWLRRVALAIRPEDPFEWVLLKDYVDIAWEIIRLRCGKAAMLDCARARTFQDFLRQSGGLLLLKQLHDNPGAKAAVLAQTGVSEQTFAAGAVATVLDQPEQADRIIAAAEERRSAKLKDIDQHRNNLAKRLRGAHPDIVDAEFEDLRSVDVGAPPRGREMPAAGARNP